MLVTEVNKIDTNGFVLKTLIKKNKKIKFLMWLILLKNQNSRN